MRGEHYSLSGDWRNGEGPSPRARGAPLLRLPTDVVRGTIPACAGSTPRTARTPSPPRDHPRVRGEHAKGDEYDREAAGPSPRARGAPGGQRQHPSVVGTIPACAGSTPAPIGPRTRPGDHPRVRGEHRLLLYVLNETVGPSPRARGALGHECRRTRRHGTIPACAGSTSSTGGSVRPEGDHPRVRGEHARPRRRSGRGPGTIPACAGSTRASPRASPRARDHPRVRGEHW